MTRVRTLATSTAAVGAFLMVFGLGACSAQEETAQGPYAAEFEQARERSVTDFQKEVLADNEITDEEFREVRQKYISCLADAGIEATANPNGQYDFALAPTAEQETAEAQCSKETIQSIEPLYYSLQVNPDNENFSELTAQCLRSKGVVDESFTAKDWDQFVSSFAAVQGAATKPDGSVPPNEDIPNLPPLPGGIAMDDPQVQQCSTTPLG